MADSTPKAQNKQNLPSVAGQKPGLTPVQAMAAELRGRGLTVSQVAERMVDHIIQNSRRPKATRLKMARNRIRAWEKTDQFRDALWDASVIKLDLETPHILAGIAKKAKAGRVDAARLALELTQRHVPKGEVTAANVNVVFEGIPRPGDNEVIDGEIVDEDDGS